MLRLSVSETTLKLRPLSLLDISIDLDIAFLSAQIKYISGLDFLMLKLDCSIAMRNLSMPAAKPIPGVGFPPKVSTSLL